VARRGRLRLVAISAGDRLKAGVSGVGKALRVLVVGRLFDGSTNDASGVSAEQRCYVFLLMATFRPIENVVAYCLSPRRVARWHSLRGPHRALGDDSAAPSAEQRRALATLANSGPRQCDATAANGARLRRQHDRWAGQSWSCDPHGRKGQGRREASLYRMLAAP